MKKKIEQILNGKFEYEQPELLFSKDRLEITLEAGSTAQGELYFGTENNDRIQGYVTSSNRRFVPGSSRFSGTTVRMPYGIDGSGMQPGEVCSGWLCVTSSTGEYKVPFRIQAVKEEMRSFGSEVRDLEALTEIAHKDFREAYRIFTDKNFATVIAETDPKQKALYAGLSRQPVTWQNLEEFLVATKQKEAVSISLKTTETEFYNVKETIQESFEIQRSGWGHLRLDIESKGGFLEPERKIVTDEEFIGSCLKLNYVIHADQLKSGNQIGEIVVRSPYQELRYQVTASKSPQIRIDIHREEKKHKAELIHDYIEYRIGHTDRETWLSRAERVLDQLKVSGCEYPEYHFYQAYIAHIKGDDQTAASQLKQYQLKEFTREELEQAGIYLYLCTVCGLYRDKGQAVWRLQNFFRQKEDSFTLLWLLLQLDSTYRTTPSKVLFMLEELYEKGCFSPLLYVEAWNLISEDVSLLHRLSPFWMQVFCFAGKHGLLTEELVMRLAYLSGYEKKFYGSLYQALAAGYEKFPSDDVLEAICKYIMKGEPRKQKYFRWFSLAVDQGLRITRLYEYYVETMDISYRRQLPKSLLMYFAYNDNSLGDARKAYVYASVIASKDTDPHTYENYKESMERFAYRKLCDGQLDENYAILYQEFLFDPLSREEGERLAPKLFTHRLYCDDDKVRQVVVRHEQLQEEEIYPCSQGVAYIRIYTNDAAILFQDDKQRRYAATIPYNLKKLTDEESVTSELLKLGVEEPGLLLHYCEKAEMNRENLAYFQRLAELSSCTETYRRSIRKKILEFYAQNVHGQDLDKYLERMDYRQYALVDRTTLLEVLISRRLFRQAMGLVEEFGYEGLELTSLLKLTSRMILKSNMAEDEELLALASEVYRNGKYDEVILYYLMKYRFGPMDELLSIWKSARGFEMETYDLEERILSLLIFTSDYRKEGEAVLESYVSQSGKERIIGAYLTQVAYGVFVKEYTMSAFVRGRLEYAYISKWPVNRICRLALLKEISREQDPKPEYIGIQQGILKECAKEHLMFGFFRRLSPELLSPYQLDDKTFVECHAAPGAKVTLFYSLDTGIGNDKEYKCEPLKEMYQGIFVRAFTLFYGETLRYYFKIDDGKKVQKTVERVLTMKKIEGTPGSRYQVLNQILSARKLGKKHEAEKELKRFMRQEQYVQNMFTIKKENEK